jgi:hypothetical protein
LKKFIIAGGLLIVATIVFAGGFFYWNVMYIHNNLPAEPLLAAEPLDVSLVQLIANPKDYDGKVVRLIGFMKLEFEGNAIYLHEDDYKHNVCKNGLWIDATDEMERRRAELDEKYVLLEETFNAKMTGHMRGWSGSIQNITRCEVLEVRKTPADNALQPGGAVVCNLPLSFGVAELRQ